MRGMNSTEFVRTIRENQGMGFPHKHQLETIQRHSVFNSAMIYIIYQPSIACSKFYPVTVLLLTIHSSSWFCNQNHYISATINSFNGFLTYHGLPFTRIVASDISLCLVAVQMLLLCHLLFHQWQHFQQSPPLELMAILFLWWPYRSPLLLFLPLWHQWQRFWSRFKPIMPCSP